MILQKVDGDDLVFIATDRTEGGVSTEALRINGNTGVVTTGGTPLSGSFTEQGAYTQTAYSTATRTVAAATTHAITDSSGGAVSTTALAVIPAATTHAITDSSGGAASTTVIAAITDSGPATADAGPVRNAFATLAAEDALLKADILALKTPTVNAIATLNAELALAKADILALKKVVNALIDDLQAVGIAG